MNYLSVEKIGKSYNERTLFEDIAFGLDQNQKTAIVGINGSGKSTLLRLLAGLDSPDSGIISFRKDLKVSILHQNPPFDDNDNVLEAVFSEGGEELKLVRDYEMALHMATNHPEKATDLTVLIEKMDQQNAWDYESKVKQILGWLGIENFNQKVSELSGGQKKRIALARALVVDPELLILDEPTNHLDLETIERLEEYLINSKLTLLMVTHDRYFLDRITNDIIELDQGKIYRSNGNYTRFLQNKEERIAQLNASVDKAKNLLRKETEWIRRQPKARGTKAKYRVDAYEELKKKAAIKTTTDHISINLSNQRQGKKILELEQVSKSYEELIILDNYNYTFKKGDRIGIIGKNGIGKSTFLDILSGKVKADSGIITKGATINIGYFTQEDPVFKPGMKVLEAVQEIAEVIRLEDGSEVSASQLLGQFLFPPKVQHQPIEKLSGGEKKRLQLLRVLIKNPNFLILDEPTNDFDLSTLEVLEAYLDSFEGCLMIVSHDRYFMNRLVDHLFIFEGNGHIRDFPGNYSQFRKQAPQNKKQDQEIKLQVKESKTESVKLKDPKKLTYSEKREFESLMDEIGELESQKNKLMDEMNIETDFEALESLGKKIASLTEQIDNKEIRWLELSEKVK